MSCTVTVCLSIPSSEVSLVPLESFTWVMFTGRLWLVICESPLSSYGDRPVEIWPLWVTPQFFYYYLEAPCVKPWCAEQPSMHHVLCPNVTSDFFSVDGKFTAKLCWISVLPAEKDAAVQGKSGYLMDRLVFISCTWLELVWMYHSLPNQICSSAACPKENNGSHWMLCPIFSCSLAATSF